MRIKVENLNYTYSEKSKTLAVHALKNVNMVIEEGEFLGVIGHTGSGKSTFIQHLNALIPLNKEHGKIVVGDFDLSDKDCDKKKLRSKVGMVFQYPEQQLFAETVFSDVEFGLKNFFKDMTETDREIAVRDALEIVGLDYNEVKEKSPFDLSGGQKRRVAIAGVIVTKPEVLILDEPVAGLDPEGRKELIALLKRLHESTVKTIILVSHDMNLVAENCSKIAVFSHGEVVKYGTPKEVFSKASDIETLNLELPLTAFLTKGLKEKGIEIDNDFTLDGFIDSFIKTRKGVNK